MFTYLTLIFYAATVSAHGIFQENTTASASASSSLPSNSTANSTTASTTAPGPSNSTIASTTLAAATTGASIAQYRQCGGATYTGPTACASPFMCIKFSDYRVSVNSVYLITASLK
ncbi:hypothetical protein F5146DRAFT_1003662 [Armillaria mellea]|nr:hypothetical protein F5146DRAFT_1003662 [Armillaria mellea]